MNSKKSQTVKPKKTRILYFTPAWPASSSGVLHSTVLAEAGYLHRNGFDCFFIGSDISDEKAAESEKHIEQTYGIPAKIFGCYSKKFGIVSLMRVIKKVARLSKDIIDSYRPTHVWGDSVFVSSTCRKIARKQGAVFVYDVQGAGCEETALLRGRGIRFWISRCWIKYELKKSDRLAGVSYKLKQWVQDLTERDDMIVVPCCFNTEKFYFDMEARRRVRRQCGFAHDEKVICYSGGLSRWQRIPDILKFLNEISNIRDNVKFLFLTPQVHQLKQMIAEHGLSIERCVIRSCMPMEVPQYLSAADVGIIIRHDIPVNNVASPIKIGEYLGCGLPVILTKGIGDYSEMIAQEGVGLVLDEDKNMALQIVNFIERHDFDRLRDNAIAFARENISWDSHLDHLKQLFRIETSIKNKE